jgi:hypothetical protein
MRTLRTAANGTIGPPSVQSATWANVPGFIPRISREQPLTAAFGDLQLLIGHKIGEAPGRCLAWSGCVLAAGRRVWDSNPRGHLRALAVFKTAAIGH